MTHANSWNHFLTEMQPGERRYIETTFSTYPAAMRTIITPRSRRPAELAGREFSATLYTAIGAASAGDVRYLICIERTK